jgi:hypothetical protein
MPEILYPDYRGYLEVRRDADNAMMALLAGSRLAAHTLQLTTGSSKLLPEIFPAVPHIGRFSLRTESARQLLLDADAHLGAVAVPYALAVHEDFVTTTLDWLKKLRVRLAPHPKGVKAWNMHEVLFGSVGALDPQPDLTLFHVLRAMRNAQIHNGGEVSKELSDLVADLNTTASQRWEQLTEEPPSQLTSNARLIFTARHIFTSFAITKSLGRAINLAIQRVVPSREWARLAVEDFASQSKKPRNSDNWMYSLRGSLRARYGPAALTDQDVEAAARVGGFWTRKPGTVVPPRK